MDSRRHPQQADQKEEPKNPEEANENIRKSQGDDATGPTEPRTAGNRPALDRDR